MIHWFLNSWIPGFIDSWIPGFIDSRIPGFIDSITDLYSGGRIDCWVKYSRREDYRNPGGGKYTNTLLSIFSSLPSLLLSSPFLSPLTPSLPTATFPSLSSFHPLSHLHPILPLLFLNPLHSFLFLPHTSLSFLLTPQLFPFYPFFSLTHSTPSYFSCRLASLSSNTTTLPYLPLLFLNPLHSFRFLLQTSLSFFWHHNSSHSTHSFP